MKNKSILSTFIIFVVGVVIYSFKNNTPSENTEVKSKSLETTSYGAFQNYRDSVPSPQQYDGPLFLLSHDYPTTVKQVVNPPWQQALKDKPISESNVFDYMNSLKSYIAPNVFPFFTNNKEWTAAKYGWFNEPWLGGQREAILGSYLGNPNPANIFKTLKEDEAGYALVLYDSTAAYTVGQIWGKTGQKINLVNDAAQFKEGSVIVKFAFSNVNYPEWPVMKGTQTFSIYDTITTSASPQKGYQVRTVSFFQMDVIVKDSKTAPKTGWVYSTFVYDMDAKGTLWDKMVPLGAMWGNDPGINSPINPPYPKLYETVINPKAPFYSKETLGWGGRLSGPNDGAVALNVPDVSGKKYERLAFSSCMSCHSPAEYTIKSSIVPADDSGFFVPGSPKWNLWFTDNAGNVPFDSGQVAMDYDLVMAYKSIPAYIKAQPNGQYKMLKDKVEAINKFRTNKSENKFSH